MDLSLLAQAGGAAGVFLAVFKFAEYLVRWFRERRADRANVEHRRAETAGVTADARVAESADYREWADRADKRAERAETRLDAAEQAAREARNKAAQLEIELANAREELGDVHKRLDRLIDAIRTCNGGQAGCPVAASVQP